VGSPAGEAGKSNSNREKKMTDERIGFASRTPRRRTRMANPKLEVLQKGLGSIEVISQGTGRIAYQPARSVVPSWSGAAAADSGAAVAASAPSCFGETRPGSFDSGRGVCWRQGLVKIQKTF